MRLIFELSKEERGLSLFPACDVPEYSLDEAFARKTPPRLPCVSENTLSRHYSALASRAFGINRGFYPLGSCTMKYNPKLNERLAALFADIHPLQGAESAQGCLAVMEELKKALCEITAMDDVTLQPAAGAHGEFTGLLLIKKYHEARGDFKRTKIIVPDSAHGTNPASAAMAGFTVVSVPSAPDGCVDLDALQSALDDETAGLMLTNPNTVGLFDVNILTITRLVHEAGGLNYYDGANLNAVMGIARPGDMGFDVVHMNLHKTFSTPHGGGGPGSGPVGCKKALSAYLPQSALAGAPNSDSIGQVKAFNGNFLVCVKALAYIKTLGANGLKEASETAVLNANYLMKKLRDIGFEPRFDRICMHEFVLTLEKLKEETGVSALDVAKAMLDYGLHPPTMYFPLIVHEALMFEPTETESRQTLDDAAKVYAKIWKDAHETPESLHNAPARAQVGRPDEVAAARSPRLRYEF